MTDAKEKKSITLEDLKKEREDRKVDYSKAAQQLDQLNRDREATTQYILKLEGALTILNKQIQTLDPTDNKLAPAPAVEQK